jgi:hypothetical protein
MKKQNLVVTVAGLVDAIVEQYGHQTRAASQGAVVSKIIAGLFVKHNSNDDAFVGCFGNGELGKANVPGEIKTAMDAKTAKMQKDKREAINKMLKVRLSEARKLRKLGGIPAEGEDVQAALKRYNKPAEKSAKPEGNEKTGDAVVIPESASMDDIADALSVWIAKHGAASKGLATKLADFLPISIKRSKAA